MLGGDAAEKLGLNAAELAGEEAVTELSRLLNATLVKLFADPQKRSWYNLFMHMDTQRTGMIKYAELLHLIRHEMRIPKAQCPAALLQSVWKHIDGSASGNITAGEFGTFMRLAPYKPVPPRPPPQTVCIPEMLATVRTQAAAVCNQALTVCAQAATVCISGCARVYQRL